MEAFRNTSEPKFRAEWWSRRLEEQLVSLYKFVAGGTHTSSQVHISNSGKFSKHWGPIKSNLTCLLCLRRMPEHVTSCGHSMCDACVQRVGEGMIGFEYQFVVRSCTFCHTQSGLVVKLKPPTAGVRIMSLDGGGIRGIVSLTEISLLQELAGPDLPIQDFFNLTVGTSAGGSFFPSRSLSLLIPSRRTQRARSRQATVECGSVYRLLSNFCKTGLPP
jgi:hypothetical protein